MPSHRHGKGGVAGSKLLNPGCLPSTCLRLCLHPDSRTACGNHKVDSATCIAWHMMLWTELTSGDSVKMWYTVMTM